MHENDHYQNKHIPMTTQTKTKTKRGRGRPSTLQSGRARTVYLDDHTYNAAQRIGSGSASAGIRIAVEKTLDQQCKKNLT